MKSLPVFLVCALSAAAAGTPPAAPAPGDAFLPPARPAAPGAPVVCEHSASAGPDETFLLVGEGLTTNLSAWGAGGTGAGGQAWTPRVQFCTGGMLAATLPEKAHDGLFLVWVRNEAGGSAPVVLNRPDPWWCAPDTAAPGGVVRVFGRNLARRPDGVRAFVRIESAGGRAADCVVTRAGPYCVAFRLPSDLAPGDHALRLHAGSGGDWGWSDPLPIRIAAAPPPPRDAAHIAAGAGGADLQRALDAAGRQGGGRVALPAGEFRFSGTLTVPAGVELAGAGMGETVLQLVRDDAVPFARLGESGWDRAPGAVHTPGDTIEYLLELPASAEWTIWVRYATDMSPWKQTGVSGRHALSFDGGAAVSMDHLTNTGGFGVFRWARTATARLGAGRHAMTWRNVKGGGVSLDAFAFSADPSYVPADDLMRADPPSGGRPLVLLQAEDCVRFSARDGNLPVGDRAAVWLAGDGASVRNLAILGNDQVNLGIALRSPAPGAWVRGCVVEGVRVADIGGKHAENCAVHLRRADRAAVRASELGGRVPLFLSGARGCELARNRLLPATRFGGNAEAVILSRCEPLEACVIEDNLLASPPGAEAGGPTARRMVWISTGHGSVAHNWIAGNAVEHPDAAGQPRFGGVAGTDQNVGEMILFEGNHRTAYFGPLAAAGARSVTLPETVPATPDARLGSVKREQLAHDAAGREIPFRPPDADDGTAEPPIGEYFVTVFSGAGRGQTRRVTGREGAELRLDRPWRVPPDTGSVVAVGTAFHRNLIVGNRVPDGMTGIQLWISCIENVVAGNTIARQRKPGVFLYANGSTLASSMPRTWNRGISPLFWNTVEGNRCDECSNGALVTCGDGPGLPVEFPRALGNVLRHNSFVRNRECGVVLAGRGPAAGAADPGVSIAGTVVEFNVVRDAATAYRAGSGVDATVFRRDHAYFWNPVGRSTNAPVAFEIAATGTTAAVELNAIEGPAGGGAAGIVGIRRGPAGR